MPFIIINATEILKTNKSFKPYSIKTNEPDIKRFNGCVSSKKERFSNVISNDTSDKRK